MKIKVNVDYGYSVNYQPIFDSKGVYTLRESRYAQSLFYGFFVDVLYVFLFAIFLLPTVKLILSL